MPETSYLSPQYTQYLREPRDGDTPLMRAIRLTDQDAIEALLGATDTDAISANAHGETALYLALRAGQFGLLEKLNALGAPDADGIVTDPSTGFAPQHWLSLIDRPWSDEEAASFYEAGPPVRTLKF